MLNTNFPIRKDRYGLRYVFFLGNEGGNCKYQCTFCEIGKSNAVSSKYNVNLFDNLFEDYLIKVTDKRNHLLLYNRGNITDKRAFSRKTLAHILTKFKNYHSITHLSLNSREQEVTNDFIDFIFKMNLPYPIHFILGQESFSDKTDQIIGKNSNGEFVRLNNKISQFNSESYFTRNENYKFGIDVNLLFLPELYIGKADRKEYEKEIKKGLLKDVKKVLINSSEIVPITINIHPYYKVKSLPFENTDVSQLIDLLPQIQDLVTVYNKKRKYKTSVFIGFRGIKTGNKQNDLQIDKWNKIFDLFNTNSVLF